MALPAAGGFHFELFRDVWASLVVVVVVVFFSERNLTLSFSISLWRIALGLIGTVLNL